MFSMDPVNVYQGEMQLEVDLCSLLQTMKIDNPMRDPAKSANFGLPTIRGLNEHDDPMDEVNYHSDEGSDYSSSSSNSNNANNIVSTIGTGNLNLSAPIDTTATTTNHHLPIPPQPQPPTQNGIHGCIYLQTIREQFDNYPTTGGEYLETIFTHREILNSFPPAHRDCARAFSDLAYSMEQRGWRTDRDADMEAVTAFRHEAWMIASTLAPTVTPEFQEVAAQPDARRSLGCIMPPMY